MTWIYNFFLVCYNIFSGDQTTWMRVDCTVGEKRQKRKTSRHAAVLELLVLFSWDETLLTRRRQKCKPSFHIDKRKQKASCHSIFGWLVETWNDDFLVWLLLYHNKKQKIAGETSYLYLPTSHTTARLIILCSTNCFYSSKKQSKKQNYHITYFFVQETKKK